MNNGLLLAFDVGGTYIKAGIIAADGTVLERSLTQYESCANGTAEEIIAHFISITRELAAKINGDPKARISGIGYAFPGPFDYERGISYIRELNKFEAIYGVNIGEKLRSGCEQDAGIAASLAPGWRLAFENDASLFALGEAVHGAASAYNRVVCMTIGTGLGSGFVENGRLVKRRSDVPENGWLYHVPYENGVADDFVSRRGVLGLAAQLGLRLDEGQDVRELAQAALAGDEPAIRVFRLFGERMGSILEAPLLSYRPDAIVIGGQIAKSGELFLPALADKLRGAGLNAPILLSENTLLGTFRGIYHLVAGADVYLPEQPF